jgi:hypothetical protein
MARDQRVAADVLNRYDAALADCQSKLRGVREFYEGE